MDVLNLIIGFAVGFFVLKITSGKKEGEIGLCILLLKTNHRTYHLHHWLIALIILVVLIILGISNDFVFGILIGAFIQGLTYKDFYEFVVEEKRKKKKSKP